ncbi:MAG TPA: glycosyl hydrolase [Jatrophihabitans sp.]|nr:glycosyl hydrolase [Jatrophihabitans sp.]
MGDQRGITRRRLLGLSAAAAAGVLVPWGGPASAEADEVAGAPWPQLAGFGTPPPSVAPKFRWWWPNGQVDPAEIAREVDAVADAGCGGLEVSDVHHSGLLDLDVLDHGWASASWLAGLDAALTRAVQRGISIDLTIGPSWPAAVPTITPDSAAASTELAHGVISVAGGSTFSGAVPPSVLAPDPAATEQTLFAVQAARTTGPAVKGVTPLDQTSLVDLTGTVVDGQLTWTPPTGDTWVLLSYWIRGSGQQPEAGPFTTPTSYVVDHFSPAGTDAVTGFWDEHILTSRIRRLLRLAGGAFFEDSLEIETQSTVWTRALPAEFAARVSYDVQPFLPVVVQLKGNYQFTYDVQLSTHVRDDVNTVLSDLYRGNHLLALREWAHELGMQLRVQAYGLPIDSLGFAALLDIPEGESLGFKNLDDYRVLAGGRDLAGHRTLSCEAIAYANGAYSTTWNKALQTIGSFWAGGVNQSVIHGFAYADAAGATWPGFAAFSPYNKTGIGYADAWGPRMPTWQHMPDIAAYLARTQHVLQTGRQHYDLLFYRQKGYASTGIGAPWATGSGIPIGWTHTFATDAALQQPGVVVRDGVLAPDGPAIKALVLGPDRIAGNVAQLSRTGAELLLGYAKAGLPIVVNGNWSNPVSTGHVDPDEDAAVAGLVKELLAQPTVASAIADTDIPLALAQLGVLPAVQYDTSTLMNVHRVEDGADFYYLANARHAENRKLVPIDQTAWLAPTAADAVPYRLDAWTGDVTRIAQFTRDSGRIGVRVVLNPGESTIVVLAKPGWAGEPAAIEVVASDADAVRIDGRSVVLRADRPGVYTATLADGQILAATIGDVPPATELMSWTLAAEDWQPGATADEIVKPVVHVELDALVPWSAIPQLQDASGIGRYRTTIELPAQWASGMGAVLDLGVVNDTFRVWVNGRRAPSSGPLRPQLDLAGLLRPGSNTIEVEVATTLINRLRTVTPSIYGIAARQDYGLLGPVRLLPYVAATAR